MEPGTMKVKRLPWRERIYLVEIVRGQLITLKNFLVHLFRPSRRAVIEYPEEQRNYSNRFRGVHQLLTHEDGSLRCVACMMCPTNCPADCITIVAAEHADPTIEKVPVRFAIDMLRCVFCGYCVEACPKDAIIMTREFDRSFFYGEQTVWEIEQLRDRPEIKTYGPGFRPRY
jgi:NADH-quinone oxidoreductase subunit I